MLKSDEKGVQKMQKRFTEQQIAYAMRQLEQGERISEMCRRLGVSEATIYKWKKKYAGMGITELKKLKSLEEENQAIKKACCRFKFR